jgi:hypothetical protein
MPAGNEYVEMKRSSPSGGLALLGLSIKRSGRRDAAVSIGMRISIPIAGERRANTTYCCLVCPPWPVDWIKKYILTSSRKRTIN